MEDNSKKIIGNYLVSALDLEDKMSIDVYGEFLERSAWPVDLDEKVFENIKKLLTVVVRETEMHKKIFLGLQNKLNAD